MTKKNAEPFTKKIFVEAARVAQVDNHCCSRAQVFTNTTCLLNKNFSGNQFD